MEKQSASPKNDLAGERFRSVPFSSSYSEPIHKSDGVERSEWKYRISSHDRVLLIHRLLSLFDYDENQMDESGYEIHSLYFDDAFDSFARGNDAGDSIRFKYRIRYYNQSPSFLRLEKKTNSFGLYRKESAVLTEEDYGDLCRGDYSELFWRSEDPLIRKFCAEGMSIRCFRRSS
ncbi:MAG: VTC domain-containing protein [Lachnospiraceae bacterium]|nr:VTC domain-containing protein [Lachnospiraceae bacterium]